MARLAERALSARTGTLKERYVRLEVAVGSVDILLWLREQSMLPKLYWSGRNDGFEVASVGLAGTLGDVPPAIVRAAARGGQVPPLPKVGPQPRYYGGLRFDPLRRYDREWAAFGTSLFILPRFELQATSGRGAILRCNLILPRDADRQEEILTDVASLSFPNRQEEGILPLLPQPVSRTDGPSQEGWTQNIEHVLAAIEHEKFDKVVLARRVELEFEEDLDPMLLVKRLKTVTPGCFHFLVQPEERGVFLGASPERLFRREGRRVFSEAVAGTRPRSGQLAEDRRLREELLQSEKDRTEQAHVRVGLRESLAPLCENLEVQERAVEVEFTLRRHLVSGVEGVLREGVTDMDILRALHPTPAVGGYRRQEALKEIRCLEPFDRGWYAGPLGWMDPNGAEFAVGIRSGLLLENRKLALFSGAGIVAGSTPGVEWEEIEQKLGDFSRVLRVESKNG